MAGKASADEDEAISVENGQAFEREAQSPSKFSPLGKTGCFLEGPLKMGLGTGEKKPIGKQGSLQSEGVSAGGKGKGVLADPDV